MKNQSKEGVSEPPFSPVRFITIIVLTMSLYMFGAYFLAPETFKSNLEAPWWSFIVVFLIAHLVNAFVEHPFHRYVLHMPVIPGLRYFYKQHTLHHGLTNVRATKKEGDVAFVINRYPIVEPKQHEASFFPWYTCAAFTTLSLGVVAFFQWLFPSFPILITVPFALAWSLSLYEFAHAVEHWSYETFWKPKVSHPRFGRFWTKVYCFHLKHHADIRCNEGISAFFLIPIPDFVFGTYSPWKQVYEDGKEVSLAEFRGPERKPYWLIRTLDSLAEAYLTRRRAQQSA